MGRVSRQIYLTLFVCGFGLSSALMLKLGLLLTTSCLKLGSLGPLPATFRSTTSLPVRAIVVRWVLGMLRVSSSNSNGTT